MGLAGGVPDVEGAGEDVDLDARGDDGLAVGLDGVVWLLKSELGMAAVAHANRWQLGVVAIFGQKEHGKRDCTRDGAAGVADVEYAVAGVGIGTDAIARAIRGAQLNRHDDRPHALGGRPVKADCHGVVAIAQAKLLKSRKGVERRARQAGLFAQLGGAQADGGIDADRKRLVVVLNGSLADTVCGVS